MECSKSSQTCFLCLSSEGDPKKEVSLKSILRYLQISSQQQTGNGLKYSSSSSRSSKKSFLDFYFNLSGSNVSVVLCEGKCANVRNRLVELIQLWETVQMKIGHWLEQLEELILEGDDKNNHRKQDGHSGANLKLLRTAIFEKCKHHKRKVAEPEVNMKRLAPKEIETLQVSQQRVSKSVARLPKLRFLKKNGRTPQPKSSLTNPAPAPLLNEFPSTSATSDADADDVKGEPVSLLNENETFDSAPNSPSALSPLQEEGKSAEDAGPSQIDEVNDDPNWLPSPPPPSQGPQVLKVKRKQRKPRPRKPKKAKSEHKNSMEAKGKPEEPARFQCSQCGKLFSKLTYLKRHIERHSGLKVICEKCGKALVPGNMLNHLRYYCPGSFSSTDPAQAQPRFPCPDCGKTFSKGHFYTHVQHCVKKVRHECPRCKKKFACQGSLRNHRLVANCKPPEESEKPRNYICTVCGKGFGSSHVRWQHFNHSHRKPGRFVCPDCGKKFNQNIHLRRHLNSFHVDPGSQVRFKCEEKDCDKSFIQKVSLKLHMVQAHNYGKVSKSP